MTQPMIDNPAPEFDFMTCQKSLKQLVGDWSAEIMNTEERRRYRDIDISVEQLQAKGMLKSDEMLIPIRVINANIRREQPSYMAFITQSWRLAIFRSRIDPNRNTLNLERSFTEGLRYSGWEIPFFKTIDGAQLHGWDSLEIEYDDSKPFHVGFDHVGHENLLFPKFIKDLEFAEMIMRRYEFTSFQLKAFVKTKGFDQEQTTRLLQSKQNLLDQGREEKFEIYKVYKKDSAGIVNVAWASMEAGLTSWLKPFEPLWMGRTKMETITEMEPQNMGLDPLSGDPLIVPVPVSKQVEVQVFEKQFPIKVLRYNLSEKSEITSNYGRAFEDQPAQDAQTALVSSFINGTNRACNIYGSPKTADGSGVALKQTEVQLEHGMMYNQPIEFWNTPYPPMAVMDAAGRLDTMKQSETGQLAYSVMTRRDTEKTATELNMAKDQSQLLSTVQVTLLATWLRQVFTQTWLVVQSLALKSEIQIPRANMEEIGDLYDIESSGSTDVVDREKKLQRRQQLWPIIVNTPIAQTFLADILRETLPEDAERYIQAMAAGDQKAAMIQKCMSVMQELIMGPNGQIKPEYKANEQQFLALAQQAAQVQQSTL